MRKMIERTFSGTTSAEITARERAGAATSRRAAEAGIVLLKNEDGILPLAKGAKIALYGRGASHTIKGGTGSGDVNERESISIWQGMKEAGFEITNEKWLTDYEEQFEAARSDWREDILERTENADSSQFFHIYASTPFAAPAGTALDRDSLKAEGAADQTAIYILSRVAGEGADRYEAKGDYYLSDDEHQMLADICDCYRNIIVLLNTGGQVDLSFLEEFPNIKGLIQMGQAGMEGGRALAAILDGDVDPSGKLTDTWTYHYSDYPEAENFSHNNNDTDKEVYREGIYVGYRYFDSYEIPVRYGFGFGLSYTNFRIHMEDINLEKGQNPSLDVTVTVENTGKVPGREVAEVYASLPVGRLEKEYRRLIGFSKTDLLAPGQKQTLALTIPLKQFASYDEEKSAWVLEAGKYGIWTGSSLEEARCCGILALDAEAVLEQDTAICPVQQEFEEYRRNKEQAADQYRAWTSKATELQLPVLELETDRIETRVIHYKKNSELTDHVADVFVRTLSEEDCIRLSSGDPGKAQGSNLGAAGISVPGSAGETSRCAVDRNLASIVLADGPAGLRLMQYYFVKDGKIVSFPFSFSLENGYFCPEAAGTEGERYYQYCTAIPTGVVLAQTWDTDLVSEVGEMIGHEMEQFGVTLWLAPGMCIHRNPLCGRNFEYYSEDPVLTGFMAAAMTNGVQRIPGVGTTIKHFACNNAEDNRMASDSILSERTLREIYMKGFEIAVKASQPMAIMTSYNLINGVHAANNEDLCTKAARCEWNFRGLIMTDWTTTNVDDTCTASGCMRAGNDLVMPGAESDHDNLRRELAEGRLDPADLCACISRIVSIIWQSNAYEGAVPYRK